MKQIIFLLAFLFSVSIGFATSSEDIYTLEQACALSHGSHLGQITSLQNDSRFRDTIENSEYSI